MSKLQPMRQLTPKKLILIAYDLAASVVSLGLAVYIFFEGQVPNRIFENLKMTWFVFAIFAAICFRISGFYTEMWPYARGSQYLVLLAGTVLQLALSVGTLQIMKRNFPLAVYITYWFILTSAVFAIRIFYRFYKMRKQVRRVKKRQKGEKQIRVMIVGAGQAGGQIIVELKTSQSRRVPLLAIDDNPLIRNYKNNGVPVLGDRHDIVRLAEEYRIDEIIVAIPSASSETLRNLLKICQIGRASCRERV